jgi:hypothetical protein
MSLYQMTITCVTHSPGFSQGYMRTLMIPIFLSLKKIYVNVKMQDPDAIMREIYMLYIDSGIDISVFNLKN